MKKSTLLLTGATGFVGRALQPSLVEAGWHVRALTRDVERARKNNPDLDWVKGDVSDEASCVRALEGCQVAIYLVHGIGEGANYHSQEVAAAETFSKAAAKAKVERIVYLGGVAPAGIGSDHLRSRLDVGETLRAGSVKTIELRASMIVGHGSLSWLIVRDLTARLPFMILPRWLKSQTEPVAIDDVVIALVRAVDINVKESEWFDIPGPSKLSGKQILIETAKLMGLAQPFMLEAPLLSPNLSSHWVRFVSRAQWAVAREIVIGLTEDLLAKDDRFWRLIGHTERLTFQDAARLALAVEQKSHSAQGAWGAVERMRGLSKGANES